MILLDTCALLWLSHDKNKLSDHALLLIQESAIVYVSAITGFEIGIKAKAGKLSLPVLPGEWFINIIRHHGLSIINLDTDICIKATELPLIHKDPCDRFIIATAVLHSIPVITADQHFGQYGIQVIS